MAHSSRTFDRRARPNNEEYIRIAIPPELASYLDIEVGDKIRMQKEDGEKGKYCSFWRVEENPDGGKDSSTE